MMKIFTLLILTAIFSACASAEIQKPPSAQDRPLDKTLKLESLERLDPNLRNATRLTLESEAHGRYQEQLLFKQLTTLDSLAEEIDVYQTAQKSRAQAQGNDLAEWSLPPFRHRTSGTAYGDFDGDGLADVYSEFEAEPEPGKEGARFLTLIWFGGESVPRVFNDFRIVIPAPREKLTDRNFESKFPPKPRKSAGGRMIPAPWIQSTVPTKFAIRFCPVAIRPGEFLFGNAHSINVNRAVLAHASCDTTHNNFYVFSKDRESVFLLEATSM